VHEPGPEEVFVVSGVFNDGVRDYPAGSFIHAPAATSHVAQSRTGCVLFLFYPEGLRARRLQPRERDDG
jgi:anti-sigma factor ChrR (cupin superfamily)